MVRLPIKVDRLASSQGGAPVSALQLHHQVVKANGLVSINSALVALRKDHFQVPVPADREKPFLVVRLEL